MPRRKTKHELVERIKTQIDKLERNHRNIKQRRDKRSVVTIAEDFGEETKQQPSNGVYINRRKN